MKLLKHIEDKPVSKDPKLKTAARAVLFDESGKVAILDVSKYGFHKIPGGEVEKGENVKEGLMREIKEEAGCTAEITGEVGKIMEFRSKWNLLQTSYCYLAKVKSKGKQKLTEKEKKGGFGLSWITLDEAIGFLQNDQPKNYEGKFIRERELRFLEEAKKVLTSRSVS